MASLIPGYNYDIFISYRQKDNKGDRWVSEFVDALKDELESTFKEEISVYFDIDPHNGLQETHDVDESLKDKLKCLVFIPIISRTYCDPKSFAWANEFKAFVNLASRDQFGLKVKLAGGNVASRVLPVQIYELDKEDINLCENVLGGVMRGIEFIYKSSGVNRPLSANEEHSNENINKTNYRDQINKVANSIKEIISALAQDKKILGEVQEEAYKPEPVKQKDGNTKIIVTSVIALLLIILGFIFIPKLIKPKRQLEKSIAVLPFFNDSPVDSNQYFINGIMEEVLNNLQKIKALRVLSRTSTDQYKSTDRPTIPEIAKTLNVNYLVEGSGQKYGNKFVLRVQLILADNERHLWAKSYNKEIKQTTDIISVQSEIAQLIATELNAVISPEEEKLIKKTPTTSLTAYDYFQRGREEHWTYMRTLDMKYLEKAEKLYREALADDPEFAQAYSGLAWIYWNKNFWNEFFSENFLDSVLVLNNLALSYDDQLSEAYNFNGAYYGKKGNTEQAIKELDEAIKINPNDWMPYWFKGMIYSNIDLVKAIDNFNRAISLNRGNQLPGLLNSLAWIYQSAGFTDKFQNCIQEEMNLTKGDSMGYFWSSGSSETFQGNYEKAVEFLEKAYKMDTNKTILIQNLGLACMMHGDNKKSLKYFKKFIEKTAISGEIYLDGMHRIGYVYWQNGYKKEADYYFNKQEEYCNESIKLKREYGQNLTAYYDLAAIYSFRGDKEKAYDNLRKFNQRKWMNLFIVSLIKNDPFFNNIRGEPEFQQMIRNVETKYQAEHERVGKWLKENNLL